MSGLGKLLALFGAWFLKGGYKIGEWVLKSAGVQGVLATIALTWAYMRFGSHLGNYVFSQVIPGLDTLLAQARSMHGASGGVTISGFLDKVNAVSPVAELFTLFSDTVGVYAAAATVRATLSLRKAMVVK